MTMPKQLNAWPLLSLLLLMQSRSAAGQAFFMDGAPGCNSNGYGITIQELNIECEADNEDGACYFDDLVTISGTGEWARCVCEPATSALECENTAVEMDFID
jgi:hypothetical protein